MLTVLLPLPAVVATKEEYDALDIYAPSHPWYYLYHGPLLPDQIGNDNVGTYYSQSRKRSPEKHLPTLEEDLRIAKFKLVTDTQVYNDLRKNLYYYKHWNPFQSPHENCMDWCMAMSLKHNHISYDKAQIRVIEKLIAALSK